MAIVPLNDKIVVQRMEAEAAALGIEDRRGEQVIEVHRHRRQHHDRRLLPLGAPDEPGRGQRHRGVQEQVQR